MGLHKINKTQSCPQRACNQSSLRNRTDICIRREEALGLEAIDVIPAQSLISE